jgi:hypothetical protein
MPPCLEHLAGAINLDNPTIVAGIPNRLHTSTLSLIIQAKIALQAS